MRFTFGSRRTSSQDLSKPTSVLGKIGISLFFFVFFAMGAGFCILLAAESFENLSTYSWNATEATISQSQADRDKDGDYSLIIRYHYTVNNRPYTSVSYNDPDGDAYVSDDFTKLARLAAKYPAGSPCTAYVDPSDPARAILAHPTLWVGLVVFFPLIFVAIGAGGIYYTWFGKSGDRKSIAARGRSKRPNAKLILRGMGTIFTLVGVCFGYFFFVKPILHIQSAKSWVSAPGTVLASRVVSHDSDDGTTYSVDIFYEYESNGQTFRSNRYHFTTGSSSGYGGKKAIVNAHPPGKAITVYVDPSDPFEAVVDRGYPTDLWFGLIPLVFFIAGIAMLTGSFLVGRKRGRPAGMPWLPAASVKQEEDQLLSGPLSAAHGRVRLKASASPLGKLIGIIVMAVFWNGITSIFVTIAVNSHLKGDPEWFLTFFIIPFVLIGIGCIGAVVYQCLALLNPSPVIESNTASPSLGDTLMIDWRLQGRAGRISTLTISLVGQEHATYRRGTDTVTDKHIFYDEKLLETSDLAAIVAGGHLEAMIPADVMHSFESDNNKIAWSLNVVGDIKRWPDMKADFSLVLRPIDPETIRNV